MRGAVVFTLVLVAALLGACNSAAPIYCTPDEAMCHGSCAALYKDAENCGACDAVCSKGLVCSQGTCATSCLVGMEQCGSSCVETFIDRDNCGACGHACGPGEVCSKGACATTCVSGQKLCLANAPYCANIGSDNANCGDCGVHCPAKKYCVSGQCSTSCALEQTFCADECVNLQSDAAHCGACNVVCAQNEHCLDGVCTCPQGQTECGNTCVDVVGNDKNNCGACGQKCTGTCEAGRCAIVLDYTSSAAESITQDATHVFWTETNGEVHQASKTAPTYLVLGTDAAVSSLAVDASNVYWPSSTTIEIAGIGGNGSSSQSVPSAAGEVATDGSYVYVADAAGIRRFPSGGGTVATIVTDTSPHALTTSNGLIFWANGAYQLERANADGTSQSTLATMSAAIDRVVTDGTNVYFTSGSYVLSVPVLSSSFPLVLASGLVGLAGIATDGTDVYWVDSKSISRVPVNGGATTKLHASSGDIVQIVVDGTAVYWASTNSQIGKISPK